MIRRLNFRAMLLGVVIACGVVASSNAAFPGGDGGVMSSAERKNRAKRQLVFKFSKDEPVAEELYYQFTVNKWSLNTAADIVANKLINWPDDVLVLEALLKSDVDAATFFSFKERGDIDVLRQELGLPAVAGAGPAAEGPAAAVEGWTCPACTLDNTVDSPVCNACGGPAPAGAGPWKCPACELINKTGKTECEMCQLPRPLAHPPVAAARWTCDLCGRKNNLYQECFDCCQLRPATIAAEEGIAAGAAAAGAGQAVAVAGPAAARSAAAGPAAEGPAAAVGEWACPRCTLINKDELVECEACETPRCASVLKERPWTCHSRRCRCVNAGDDVLCAHCRKIIRPLFSVDAKDFDAIAAVYDAAAGTIGAGGMPLGFVLQYMWQCQCGDGTTINQSGDYKCYRCRRHYSADTARSVSAADARKYVIKMLFDSQFKAQYFNDIEQHCRDHACSLMDPCAHDTVANNFFGWIDDEDAVTLLGLVYFRGMDVATFFGFRANNDIAGLRQALSDLMPGGGGGGGDTE